MLGQGVLSFIWRLKCTGIIGIGVSRFVLYREVFFIRSVLYRRFHCKYTRSYCNKEEERPSKRTLLLCVVKWWGVQVIGYICSCWLKEADSSRAIWVHSHTQITPSLHLDTDIVATDVSSLIIGLFWSRRITLCCQAEVIMNKSAGFNCRVKDLQHDGAVFWLNGAIPLSSDGCNDPSALHYVGEESFALEWSIPLVGCIFNTNGTVCNIRHLHIASLLFLCVED